MTPLTLADPFCFIAILAPKSKPLVFVRSIEDNHQVTVLLNSRKLSARLQARVEGSKPDSDQPPAQPSPFSSGTGPARAKFNAFKSSSFWLSTELSAKIG